MREASSKHEADPPIMGSVRTSDAMPITRHSLAALAGDENDLLSESPVFTKSKGAGAERAAQDIFNSR